MTSNTSPMNLTKRLLLLGFLLLPVQGAWAIDNDLDGSDSVEESRAGTSDNDPTQRPYWWKTIFGYQQADLFGHSVAAAGDVNGDGFADVIVGARGENYYVSTTIAGYARVFSGLDMSILYTFDGDEPGDNFGAVVRGAGDVNADGVPDLIVGAPSANNNSEPWEPGAGSGAARVFSGANGSILYTFDGDDAWDGFGSSLSGVGDVNGDGHADLIVGAPYDDNNGTDSGSARVYSGANGSILYSFNGPSTRAHLGGVVSGPGDVNGDGYADFTVGGRVFSGLNGTVMYTVNAGLLGVGGDVNGDGVPDLIAPASSQVISGVNGTVLYYVNIAGLKGVGGDVNGDGVPDLIAGFDAPNPSLGSGKIFSGANGSVLNTFNGYAVAGVGGSVSGAGDMDGDGLTDLIMGAIRYTVYEVPPPGYARAIHSSDLMNDSDLDYRINSADNCPLNANPDQADSDSDGVGNLCDNCRSIANPLQEDANGDGCGDACITGGCGGPICANN